MDKDRLVDFTPNIWNHSVEIESHIWNGYRYYVEYLEVSLDEHNTLRTGEYDFSYRIKSRKNDNLARWTGRDNAVQFHGESVISTAEILVIDLFEYKKPTIIERGKKTKAWELISSEAEDLGMPVHFKSDLYSHDAMNLGYFNPQKFLWIIRETGTWLFKSWTGIDDTFARAAIEQDSKNSTARIYLYKDGELNRVRFEDYIT